MYRIKLTQQAKKELKNIKIIYKIALTHALEVIRDNPFFGKPLARELTGQCSYKVGVYRIIYKINPKDKSLIILSAGHRATVYK